GGPETAAEPGPAPDAEPDARLSPHDFQPEPDARSHMGGPNHGPTALAGHFLARELDADADAGEPTPPPPTADEALVSRRIVTTIDTVEAASRPLLIRLLCAAVVLVALAFLGRFVWEGIQRAGGIGVGIGVVGAALAALAVVRVWTGNWDGLVPLGLFAVVAAGGALLLASAAAAPTQQSMVFTPFAVGLLAGDALILLLTLLAVSRLSCRAHLAD
ncbi:MAG: hypothetical protein ACODAJ_08040, partial [Planctomycetota bacterium]